MASVSDLIPKSLRAFLSLGDGGPWYGLNERAVNPFVREAGRGVNFTCWFEAPKPRANHGDLRSWLVLGFDPANRSRCAVRPAHHKVKSRVTVPIPSHAGAHLGPEQSTCRFQSTRTRGLVCGESVFIALTLLRDQDFQCVEPRFEELEAGLLNYLKAKSRKPREAQRPAHFPPAVGDVLLVQVTHVAERRVSVVEPVTRCRGTVSTDQLAHAQRGGDLRGQLAKWDWLRVETLGWRVEKSKIRYTFAAVEKGPSQ